MDSIHSPEYEDINRDIYNYFTDKPAGYVSPNSISDASSEEDEEEGDELDVDVVYDKVNQAADAVIRTVNNKLRTRCAAAAAITWQRDHTARPSFMGPSRVYNLEFQGRRQKVMSRIVCEVAVSGDAVELTIDSETDERYRGRRYNLLLRAIMVQIAYNVKQLFYIDEGEDVGVYVMSQAMNPVSFYTLARYFDIVIEDIVILRVGADEADKEAMMSELINLPEVTWSAVETAYKKYAGDGSVSVFLFVRDTVENNNRAVDIINRLIVDMRCSDGGGGGGGERRYKSKKRTGRAGFNRCRMRTCRRLRRHRR